MLPLLPPNIKFYNRKIWHSGRYLGTCKKALIPIIGIILKGALVILMNEVIAIRSDYVTL